jgi:hypothetical protein
MKKLLSFIVVAASLFACQPPSKPVFDLANAKKEIAAAKTSIAAAKAKVIDPNLKKLVASIETSINKLAGELK